MQVDPIKPKLKPPETKCLKLKCDGLHSTFAFKFNLRRFMQETSKKLIARLVSEQDQLVEAAKLGTVEEDGTPRQNS